jgi:hypothetical protein
MPACRLQASAAKVRRGQALAQAHMDQLQRCKTALQKDLHDKVCRAHALA